jgi:L-threonylcarbamoyladenylate synthase
MKTRSDQLPKHPFLAATDAETISIAASILRSGGVVAVPTDTVYGLAASLFRPEAIDRIYHMKSRPISKAIPVLVSDFDQVFQVATPSAPAIFTLAKNFWPGALTVVLNARKGLPHQVVSTDVGGHQTVAVRLPDHAVARQIIDAAGGALAVTSANRSGEADAITADQVRQLDIGQPDAIVDAGRVAGGVPSTIVSIVGSTITILREGAISASEIHDVLRNAGHGTRAFRGSAV